MNTFYLQRGYTESSVHDYKDNTRTTLPEPREFLDTKLHRGNELIEEVPGTSWLHARNGLGPI